MKSSILSLALATWAMAEDSPDLLSTTNHVAELSSCANLTCNAKISEAVCATSDDDKTRLSVGLAKAAFQLPKANLSLTLVDGLKSDGHTNYKNPIFKYSDMRLFVGSDPGLEEENKPSGCLLMMQYQQQTFPELQYADDDHPHERFKGTTSCQGVLDPFCQSNILKLIQSYNASSSPSSDENDNQKCTGLIHHISHGLRSMQHFCGSGGLLANLMNVTGGAIPSDKQDLPDNLGSGECLPVAPKNFQLNPVATQIQYYLDDPPKGSTQYYSRLFGGRAGFTPVVAVVYEDNKDKPTVQFSCMQTLMKDGQLREATFDNAGQRTSPYPAVAASVGAAVMVAIMMI